MLCFQFSTDNNFAMNFTTFAPARNTTENPKYISNGFSQTIITFCYVMGIFGNLLALVFLCKKRIRPNNLKHKLMLKCLSMNDLTALLGMLILMYVNLYSQVAQNIWYCRTRVVWRVFGLGSGCVAFVMAVERWLALTKPFFYQKHVTIVLIKRSIFGLWILAVILACMPIFGFGLYYEYETKNCVRYREGKSPLDVAYAYLYFSLGILLCIGIVFCNIAVMRSLCFKDATNPKSSETILMRRMSRSFSKMSNTSTREELAFGRLMGLLCVIFLGCWIPQLITIPMAQMNCNRTECSTFFLIADILIALHLLLDPYVYVLHRLPTFRKLFCSQRIQHSQYKCSVKMSLYDQSYYIAKI